MSSKIRILDEHTINKIAAGEVIENPSSIVKELLENAIDAGSTEITIEIMGGGRQLIRISDNGSGMNKDDALLCFERHATSKIKEINDIHLISTMGFRGEAVPSIAAISKLTLLTSVENDKDGTLIIVDGGSILKCSPAVRSKGTTFEVKSLFFNVPVRKKFQRSPNYDTNEIFKVVSIQALIHPTIKFQLISNHNILLSTKHPFSTTHLEQLGERISEVLGEEFFRGMCPITKEIHGYSVTGYIGLPTVNRHNRTGQYLFINQRPVFSPLISYAIKDGYGTTLPSNRHPVFVIYLTMNGALVDVNVHPQKREVRLRQEQKLKEVMILSVEEALQQNGVHTFETVPEFSESPAFNFQSPTSIVDPLVPVSEEEWSPPMSVITSPEKFSISEVSLAQDQLPLKSFPKSETVPCQILATLQGYSILSVNNSIKLLDQRSAHSRVLYDQLIHSKNVQNKKITQALLIPQTIEITQSESLVLNDNLSHFQAMGFDMEVFGMNTYIIRSVPELVGNRDIKRIIFDLIDSLSEDFGAEDMETILEKKNVKLASRAAISSRQQLSLLEVKNLYSELMLCKNSQYCPLGKPIMVTLSADDCASLFQNSRGKR